MVVKDHTGRVIGSCFDKATPGATYLAAYAEARGDAGPPEQVLYPLMHHTAISASGLVEKWSIVRLTPGQDPQHLPGWLPA